MIKTGILKRKLKTDMSFTKIWKLDGTNLEVEMMSSGITHLWKGDEKVIGSYQATKESQKEMVQHIKRLFPNWKVGQITRKQ